MQKEVFDGIVKKLLEGSLIYPQKVDLYILAKALLFGADRIRRDDRTKLAKWKYMGEE